MAQLTLPHQPDPTKARLTTPMPSSALSDIHTAYFGTPVFSPTLRAVGPTALEFTPPTFDRVPVTRIAANVEAITSSTQVLEKLGVAVQAGYSGASFQTSAKIDFARSIEVNQYCFYFLLTAVASSDALNISALPELRERLRFTTEKGARNFYRGFGDLWISQVFVGGSIYALIEVQTDSRSTREQIAASFELSASGGKLEASFRSEFQKIVTDSSLRITYIQEGGNTVLQSANGLSGLDQVLAQIQAMWSDIEQEPAVIGWQAIPYINTVQSLDDPPPFVKIEYYTKAAEDSAGWHRELGDRVVNLRFALDHPERFEKLEPQAVLEEIEILESLRDDLEDFLLKLEIIDLAQDDVTPRRDLFAEKVNKLIRVPLPAESPIFELFALPLMKPAFTSHRDFDRSNTCRRRQTETLTPIRLDITADSLRYEYILDTTAGSHKCDKAWKSSDDFRVHGFVTAKLQVSESGEVRVTEVRDHQDTKGVYSTINFGGEPLIAFIKAKDLAGLRLPLPD